MIILPTLNWLFNLQNNYLSFSIFIILIFGFFFKLLRG